MKILLAITGASGVVYGKRVLDVLSEREDIEVELIVSEAGRELMKTELDVPYDEVKKKADSVHEPSNLKAPPSSGSSHYHGMAVVPCSMSSLSKIANGISDNLITRAASVFLKENRKLVLTPRETPLTSPWLKNMYDLSREGAVVLPAMPGFYGGQESIDDLVDFVAGKILDSLEIENSLYRRWSLDR
ncbi:MAG: UbiX family flavin prenyltransferase [Candidatus Natronoplasma sp.]